MRGYLLDTNHVSAYFDKNTVFMRRLEKAPPEYLFWVSAVSLGEIEASCLTNARDAEVVVSFRKFLRDVFLRGRDDNSYVLPVDENTRFAYANVLSHILGKYPLPSPKTRTEHHLVKLGIDVNDVWIFATALKHNLTLLTTDKMEKVRECIKEDTIPVECWL